MHCSTQAKHFRWQIGDPDGDDARCTDDSSYLVTSCDKREILTFVKCTVDEPRLLKKNPREFGDVVMADSEQKALQLVAEAEKKLSSSKGFFGALFG